MQPGGSGLRRRVTPWGCARTGFDGVQSSRFGSRTARFDRAVQLRRPPAPGPAVATTNGGVVAGDDAEIIDDGDEGPWRGLFKQYGKYGNSTGEEDVQCRGCGAEVLTQAKDRTTHHEDCPHAN